MTEISLITDRDTDAGLDTVLTLVDGSDGTDFGRLPVVNSLCADRVCELPGMSV